MGIAEEIETLKNDTLATQEAAAKAGQEQREKLEALRARIKAGESIGDRLRDFALACWNDTLEGLAARVFQGIQDRLPGKIGQLAMIVEYQSRSCTDNNALGMHFENDEVASVKIGFLSDDQLDIDLKSGVWGLPCHNHVEHGAVSGLVAGCICFNDKRTTLHYAANALGMLGGIHDRMPDILVGDQEVIAWLTREQSMHRIVGEVKDTVTRRLTMFTLELRVPAGHRLEQERLSLRDKSFQEALGLESHIAVKRLAIENNPEPQRLGLDTIVAMIKGTRTLITSLGEKIDLAIKLGIDPNRPEILRMRENFGHYWKT